MKKLFVSDLDGTLYKIGDALSAGLSGENKAMIERFRAEGNIFAVASARTADYMADIRETLGFSVDYIGCNGSQIVLSDDTIIQQPLNMKFYREIDAFLTQQKIDAVITATLGNGKFLYSNNKQYPWYTNDPVAMNRYVLKSGRNTSDAAYHDEDACFKMMVLIRPDIMEEVKQKLRHRYHNELEIVSSDYDNIDMVAKGCTKGSAVLKLAQYHRIDRENIYCVGDSENDIAMFEISHISYAMSQASDEVKSRATIQVEAVWNALESLCNQNRKQV